MAEDFEKELKRLASDVQEITKSPEWKGESGKDAVHQALRPLVRPQGDDVKGDQTQKGQTTPNYLKDAPADVKEKVEELVNLVFKEGIEKATKRARQDSPFVLDAFHDALADKVYQELKKRNIIK